MPPKRPMSTEPGLSSAKRKLENITDAVDLLEQGSSGSHDGPVPKKVLIIPLPKIMTLDDDSLLEIFSYLNQKDSLSLALTDPRFKKLIVNHGLPSKLSIELGYDYSETHLWFYKAAGRKATELKVNSMKEDDFFVLLEQLPKVTKLRVEYMSLKSVAKISSFPPLESLQLKSVSVTKPYMVKLFRHLNATLQNLDFNKDKARALDELHNIRKVCFPHNTLHDDLTKFWDQNPGIESLSIGSGETYEWHNERRQEKLESQYYEHSTRIKENIKRMGALQSLESLSWTFFMVTFPRMDKCFPALKKLYLWGYTFDEVSSVFDDCAGPELTYFMTGWEGKSYDYFDFRKTPKLEHFEVMETLGRYAIDNEQLDCTPNIKILRGLCAGSDDVLLWAKKFPLLHEVIFDDKEFDEKLKNQLLAVLRPAGRVLSINGKIFK